MKYSLLLAVIATLFSALGWVPSTQAEPLRLIVTHLEPPLVPNSVMDLADELGYFEREGVEVELIHVQQTPSAVAAILSGEGDMANISVSAVLQLHAQGNHSLKAVASPNKSLPFLIAARTDITSPADLVGHSFGVGRIGSLDHSLSTSVLASEGIAMESLNIITLGQPQVRARSLAAGQVDATTMSIGTWMSLPDRTGLAVLVPTDAYFAAAPVVNKVNVVTDEALATRRDDIVAVIRAITLISRDFSENPDAWASAMVPFAPQMNEASLMELAHSFAGSWSVNAGLSRRELQFSQDWILQTEDFKGAPPISLDRWVDFSIADEVLADIGVQSGSDEPLR